MSKNNKKSRVARLGKRKTFKSIFFKRWIGTLIVFALLLSILVPTLISVAFMAMENIFYITDSNMQYALEEAYRNVCENPLIPEEEREQEFINRAKFRVAGYSVDETYLCMLYDTETGEIIADCDETFFLILRESENAPARAYTCPTSAVPELTAAFESIAGDELTFYNYYIETDIETFYIKGDEFRPGKMTAHVMPLAYNNDTLLQEDYQNAKENYSFDFTPAESGYTECTAGSYHTIVGPVVAGYGDTSFYFFPETAADAWSVLHHTYDEETGCMVPEELNLTVGWDGTTLLIVSETQMHFSENENYTLRSICYYDVADYALVPFILFIVASIILSCLICLISSKITYAGLKAHYDMEDYRKTLMNTMAHDLKSPLMSISGYAENLKESVHAEKREHYATSIMENVDHMNRIISDILSLSKTEDGNVVLNKTELNVEDLISECLKKYELQMSERKLQSVINGSLTLRADKTLFTEALDNLIGNAVKYADSESVIIITLDKKSIGIINQCKAEFDDVKGLLKPFVTGNENRSNKGGSGLGLAIAKNIMDLHKFKMNVEFEDKKFKVEIKL
ncbi:MAG: HAMP domain-containing histidine kinase [Lachnospiraceae bacterium]|nr:HAMP domain-containing histidine kinase [Lachnospiraceae bacterium]